MDVPIILSLGNLPAGATYTPQQYAQAIVDRLSGTIAGSNFIFGQLGGTEPTSPLGGNNGVAGLYSPEGTTLYAWNAVSGKYLPLANITGQLYNGKVVLTTFLCGTTANRTLTTPDKDGVIATLDDIQVFLGTQTLGGTAPVLDWTVRKQAYYVLPANSTMSMTGMADGEVQDLFVENNATAYTLTISGVSSWFGGSAPTFTTASAGERRIDHVRFTAIGTGSSQMILGEIIKQNALIAVAGGDSTPPTVSSISGTGSTITVYFNELLRGGSLNIAGFTVLKNGASDTVISAVASGMSVVINVNSSFTAANAVTVQYTGSDIKDAAGNAAAAFGPTTVTYAVVGSPVQGGGSGGHNVPVLQA